MKYSTLIFDLDGTLAPSKARPSESMCNTLCEALKYFKIAVISGARFEQFQEQLVAHLPCIDLSNLMLAPTNGSAIYSFTKGEWQCLEKNILIEEDKERIFIAIKKAMAECDIAPDDTYGPQIDDRETQITFSGCGSIAPISIKESWDADASLRIKMANIIKEQIPEFEVRVGGMTSIDVTAKGFDKASAIIKIEKYLNIKTEEILFMGDALFQGGNDEPAKRTGVDTLQVKNPEETEEKIKELLSSVIAVKTAIQS
jgi:HAD superfamily hydrolase (TIGR01484 family)